MTVLGADAAQLPAMLTQLRLPTVASLWQALTTADRESWPAARTLAALFEQEIAEHTQRRTARHLQARPPIGKTIDCFDFTAVTSISKARVTALVEGDGCLAQGTTDFVQQRQAARQDLKLATGIAAFSDHRHNQAILVAATRSGMVAGTGSNRSAHNTDCALGLSMRSLSSAR